jgi:predicted lipid carrier protein YhbT
MNARPEARLALPPLPRWLPRYPGSFALASGLNLLVIDRLPADLRSKLNGKSIAIVVTDADFEFAFRVQGSRCVAMTAAERPDLKLAATAADFAAIAAGTADADTLFFQRRLVIEGEVELATELKHSLDAIEFPRLRRLLRALLERLPGAGAA